MKLKNKTLNLIVAGLEGLKGASRVIYTDNKPSSTAFETFRFPAGTKVNIIHNAKLLKPLAEDYQEKRAAILEALTPVDGVVSDIDKSPELTKQWKTLIKELDEAIVPLKGKLMSIAWADLDVANVDPLVVYMLGILVKGLPAANDADAVPDSLGEPDPVVEVPAPVAAPQPAES